MIFERISDPEKSMSGGIQQRAERDDGHMVFPAGFSQKAAFESTPRYLIFSYLQLRL
jgi:hypothetical protein